eukprot:gene18892-20794_t
MTNPSCMWLSSFTIYNDVDEAKNKGIIDHDVETGPIPPCSDSYRATDHDYLQHDKFAQSDTARQWAFDTKNCRLDPPLTFLATMHVILIQLTRHTIFSSTFPSASERLRLKEEEGDRRRRFKCGSSLCVDMDSNLNKLITQRENTDCSEAKALQHSCQSRNGTEERRANIHNETKKTVTEYSPQKATRRSGLVSIQTAPQQQQNNTSRRSLKSVLLSFQRKQQNISSLESHQDRCVGTSSILQGANSGEVSSSSLSLSSKAQDCSDNNNSMALKRSSSVPNRVAYPLHEAIKNEDLKDLGKLFKKKRRIDIDLKDQEGFTPLHRAAQLGLTEAVELLVSHGANVNMKNKSNLTPLYYAAQSGNYECASYLIEHGADDNDIRDGFSDSKLPDFKGGKISRSRMSSVHN